jgi:hypothetical protein
MKPKKACQSTKSGVKPSFLEKNWNLHWNTKSKCDAFVKIWTERSLRQNMKPKRPSLKYEVKESFIKIRRQRKLHQNTKSSVKPSFFREKMKPSLQYEVKVWSIHQNKNPKEPSSKYKAKDTFVKIRSQRKLCQNMKPKKASSKYEPKEDFVKIRSQRGIRRNTKSKKASSKYEGKESFIKIQSLVRSLHFSEEKQNLGWHTKSKCEVFIKIRTQRSIRQNMKPKRPSLKYEVKENFIKIWRQRKLHQNTKLKCETFIKIRSQSKKPLSKYKAKVRSLCFLEKIQNKNKK